MLYSRSPGFGFSFTWIWGSGSDGTRARDPASAMLPFTPKGVMKRAGVQRASENVVPSDSLVWLVQRAEHCNIRFVRIASPFPPSIWGVPLLKLLTRERVFTQRTRYPSDSSWKPHGVGPAVSAQDVEPIRATVVETTFSARLTERSSRAVSSRCRYELPCNRSPGDARALLKAAGRKEAHLNPRILFPDLPLVV
jgi:hypothetical protein